MNPSSGEVVSGVDGFFGRFPSSDLPEHLFHSLMVYALVTPDRTGSGDRQIPYVGSPVGGVYAPVDKEAFVDYGPAQFVTADVMLGWYDGEGLVWVMDETGPEHKQGAVSIGSPPGARQGIKPFIVKDGANPNPRANITLLVDASRLEQPINGVIIRGSGLGARSVYADHYFLPMGDHAHVSHHRGPKIPTKSTRIHDINNDGEVSEKVWAGLDKLVVVMPQGDGCAGGILDENTLALNYAAKTGPGWGITVFEETGGLAPGVTAVEGELKTVMAYQAHAKKGPATAGHPTADKHKQADTPEGAINSSHDHSQRYVYANIEMDGPELFEEVFEIGVGEGVIPLRTHKQWKGDDTQEGPCGTLAGRWREHTKVPSVPIWDEPAPKDEPTKKGESAAKDESAVKGETAGKDDPVPKQADDPPGAPRHPVKKGDPTPKAAEVDQTFRVFYDPKLDRGLPEIKFPDYYSVARPDSEGGAHEGIAAAMSNVSGEWQGLPEIKVGNATVPGAIPPPDFGPLELRRHSIEYAARPNLFTKPTLSVPTNPPAPPEGLSAMGPGDPHRLAYMEELADWYDENMLKGVTGEKWSDHVKAPVGLHATAFAKTKPNGFNYNTRAQYTRSRDISRPRKFVTGTADGGVFYHPHEVKHWMLAYDYAGDDLPASPSQPEIGLRKGVRLAFMEALEASDASRGVEGLFFEQSAADVLQLNGLDSNGAADQDKALNLAVMLGVQQATAAQIALLTNMRAGTMVWDTTNEQLQYYTGSAWIALAAGTGDKFLDAILDAQQSVSSTTMASSNLSVTLAANTRYSFEAYLRVGATSSGGFKFDLDGGAAVMTAVAYSTELVQAAGVSIIAELTSALATDVTVASSTTFTGWVRLTGWLDVSSTGGTFIFRFSRTGLGGSASLGEGSWLRVRPSVEV